MATLCSQFLATGMSGLHSCNREPFQEAGIMESILLIAVFTLLSGLGDAQGFVHAGRVWDGDGFNWIEALKSAAGFQFGVFMYWFAVRHLASQGVLAPEVQTLFWFSATIIGIAALSGQFMRWAVVDQIAAVGVLLGITWLMMRTAAR